MQKLASELINQGVILRQENALVGKVTAVIIDPSTGKFMGLLLKEGFGKEHVRALAEKDILGINDQYILITSYSVLGDLDEIVRIKKIIDQKIPIIKNKVYTISGINLGKVYDYSIDLHQARLSRLYIHPKFLKKLSHELIIDSKCIVSIKKDRITVDDSCIKEKTATNVNLITKKETTVLN
jgi:sporulation protein YlmC with PRC-barrel domain